MLPTIRDPLIEQMTVEEDWSVRHAILKQLTSHASSDDVVFVALLDRITKDKVEAVRAVAFEAVVGAFDDHPALQAEVIAAAAALALAKTYNVHEQAVQFLVDNASTDNVDAANALVRNIGRLPGIETWLGDAINTGTVNEDLLGLIRIGDRWEKSAAARVLGGVAERDVAEPFRTVPLPLVLTVTAGSDPHLCFSQTTRSAKRQSIWWMHFARSSSS